MPKTMPGSFDMGENSPNCPNCYYPLEVATNLDTEEKPRPGDVTICTSCAAVLIFAKKLIFNELFTGLTVREPDQAELEEILKNPKVKEVRADIKARASVQELISKYQKKGG